MHDVVFYVASIWLSGLLATGLLLAVRRGDTPGAILAVDTSTLVLIALLLVITMWTGTSYYLDVALLVGLLAFIQTIAAARFLGGHGLFTE